MSTPEAVDGDSGSTGFGAAIPATFETERLRFEPRSPDYVDVLSCYGICSSDPGIEAVTEYLPWDPHEHPKETHDFLERGVEARREGRAVSYALRPRGSEEGVGELAGFCGLHLDWERDTATLGLWLRRRFWGRGYSGERATALIEIAFDRLDIGLVTVEHGAGNEKSERAIGRYVDRLGGRREGTLRGWAPMGGGHVDDSVRYTIAREEWLDATDGGTSVVRSG